MGVVWEAEDTQLARRVAQDHGLAAAALDSGHHGLVAHGPREAQRVERRFFERRVDAHPCAADRRSQGSIVERDHRTQARGGILDDQHFFVCVEGGELEGRHRRGPAGAQFTWER